VGDSLIETGLANLRVTVFDTGVDELYPVDTICGVSRLFLVCVSATR